MTAARSRKEPLEKSADAFRSIGEAAGELGLQTHVLRYWEGKFPEFVKPIKRQDGRRLFRSQDIEALRAVRILVHERGLTLKGARSLLKEQGVDAVLTGEARLAPQTVDEAVEQPASAASPGPAKALQSSVEAAFAASTSVAPDRIAEGSREALEHVLSDITDLKARLDAVRERKAA